MTVLPKLLHHWPIDTFIGDEVHAVFALTG
jgi:hypothetical protein